MSRVRSLVSPVGLALLAVWVIWGSTYLGIRIGLETMSPFTMQGIRFVVAGSVLYVWMRRRGVPRPTRTQWRHSALVGCLLLLGGLGLVTIAEDRGVGSGLTATMIAVSPMWLALWGGLWGRWPVRREWIGMVVGLCAVVVLAVGNDFGGSRLGMVLLLVSPVSWTFGSALTTRLDLPAGAMASACEMLAGAAGFGVLALVTGESVEVPSARSALALAYLVVFGSIVGYTAYQYLLTHTRPAVASSYAYVNPVVAVLLGTVLVDEELSWGLAVALPLVVTSVLLITSADQSTGKGNPPSTSAEHSTASASEVMPTEKSDSPPAGTSST